MCRSTGREVKHLDAHPASSRPFLEKKALNVRGQIKEDFFSLR